MSDEKELEVSNLEVPEALDEQNNELEQFAVDFIIKAIRLGGVQIIRKDFLRQELHRSGYSNEVIEKAIETTPLEAGVRVEDLDDIANRVIDFETNKSTALSFMSGLPGGFAMIATVPADVLQYFCFAFRIMQKLAYVYGWQDFITDLDDVDDETLGKFVTFLGVMLGVQSASSSLVSFANRVVMPRVADRVKKKALTKTVWYGPMKKVLHRIGIEVTKGSFGKSVSKSIPVIGGVISGSMTYVSLHSQSNRLHKTLRELPAPNMDALTFQQKMAAQKKAEPESDSFFDVDITGYVSSFVSSASSAMKNVHESWFGDSQDASEGAENLLLRPLEFDDEASALAADAEFSGTDFDFLMKHEDENWEQFLARLADESAGVNLPEDRVAATFLGAFVGDTLVGRVSIRHRLNDYLEQYGGHIGYAVLPEHRRRGYATEMLRQAVEYAHKLGVDPLLVTCKESNIGSQKVIESCGGTLENTVFLSGELMRRYWLS